LVVPVVAAGHNGALADVLAAEPEVVRAERTIRVADAAEVAGDVAVIADLVSGVAAQIIAERSEAGVELLKHNGLSLDLADLFGDDPPGHLLEDNEALLNDFDALAVADQRAFVLDDDLAAFRAVEVAGSIEVVKVVHGRETSPVVERLASAGGHFPAQGQGLCGCASSEGRDGDQRNKDLSEHLN